MGKAIIWMAAGIALFVAGSLAYGTLLVALDERAAKREREQARRRRKREKSNGDARKPGGRVELVV